MPKHQVSFKNQSGKYAQAEKPVFEFADYREPQNQGSDLGNTDDQPNVEAASKYDCFKKPERPPTPDSDWNANKSINFRRPQTWISKFAKAEKPPLTFDEMMSTPIDFSAYVMNNLKIENLIQEHLVGPAFILLKGTCRSRVELEYHFKKYRGHQVVPVNYFINNDLEYLKEEIVVRREDQKLYKFKEDDFPRLNLHDIEDMLLLLVQNKIANLEKDVIFDLNVALRMFTRRLVILKRVEDLQLDGTLTSIRSVLHDIASNLRMDYFPKRRWSKLDKQRSRIMIKAINKLQLERRLMRNLKRFIGGREYGEDFRLLEWTI
ncbi:hypothetical protein Tco_0695564 [Tanacetum coccineum]